MTEDGQHLTIDADVDDDAGVARLTLRGELDLDGVAPVSAELDRLVEEQVSRVVIDASGLTFLDSSGLRALLSGRERLKTAGATLQVEAPSPAVSRVLDMTGTRSLLESD